ncbi:hypothetical protein [Helicobacter himalayensis]|uniref:putative barnase/colicin E5 family endoribonuclease n=1 Tax=Helicobacter himalayensis TaxID=1591088 RepID=UPI000829F936|nr:hypothetical protein [Helicobacter himalayensis]
MAQKRTHLKKGVENPLDWYDESGLMGVKLELILKGEEQEFLDNGAWIYKYKDIREAIQKALNITPNKDFGTNYAEYYHDGKNAVEKLLAEAKDFKERGQKGEFSGQVYGAFYRKDLEELSGNGDISLVWGDSNFGLKHILDKHEGEFKDLPTQLNKIVERGELEKGQDNKYTIKTLEHTLVLGSRDGEFIITAYKDRRNKKLGNHQTVVSGDFTDEPLGNSHLPPNLTNTLPLFALNEVKPKPKTTREILNEHKEQGLSAKETLKKIKENKELREKAEKTAQDLTPTHETSAQA